jgi:hypothetical protein
MVQLQKLKSLRSCNGLAVDDPAFLNVRAESIISHAIRRHPLSWMAASGQRPPKPWDGTTDRLVKGFGHLPFCSRTRGPTVSICQILTTAAIATRPAPWWSSNPRRFVTCQSQSRPRRHRRAPPKGATQEPADHIRGPEGDDGDKRDGCLSRRTTIALPRLEDCAWSVGSVHGGMIGGHGQAPVLSSTSAVPASNGVEDVREPYSKDGVSHAFPNYLWSGAVGAT